MKNKSQFSTFQFSMIIICIILVSFFQYIDLSYLGNVKDVDMITNTLTRFIIGLIFITVFFKLGRKNVLSFRNIKKSILIVLPAMIISINNFPFIAYMQGRANILEPGYRIILFLAECLSIGFLEEIIFRGAIFVYLLESFSGKKRGTLISIVISASVFGLMHIANLFAGASIVGTLLQVGYSFLMGILWAVMYLKTSNLWLVMILHTTYNFFGQVMFYLGFVNGRYDSITLVITIVFAMLITYYVVILLRNDKMMLLENLGENYDL